MESLSIGQRTFPAALPSHRFTVVVGDDFEPASAYAFDQAVALVTRVPGSQLEVVHVVHEDTPDADIHRLTAMLRVYIDERCAAHPDQGARVQVRRGEPVDVIARVASEVGADVILVGARTRMHVREFLQGSLGARLARSAPCPVLVAEPRAEDARTTR